METKLEHFKKNANAAISIALKNCFLIYELEKRDDYPFLLLGGDLSGIQKFIYNIASRKAAKSLKARSKYLVDLIHEVVEQVKEDTGVTDNHVICLAGGKFYMLLPNSQKVIKVIDGLQTKFEQKLWSEHKGQLSLNFDFVTFNFSRDKYSFENQSDKTSNDLWKCLADKLTEKKNQKFKTVLEMDFDKLFEPENFNKEVKVCVVTGIESENCVRLEDKDSDSPYVLLSVKKMTVEKGDGKTFEDYADHSFLGILRMDVDNLGQTFIRRQGDFAEYASFSKWLNSFFEDNLKEICNKNEYNNHINIIYAGGDDMFAIGRWDKLILFAYEVRKEFENFAGTQNLSISGGISIVGEKFPIAKAAEMAGKAEEAAKGFNNKEKNAFNLFGESFSWKNEYDFILKWKTSFLKLCADPQKPMPRSILHKMIRLAELKRLGDMKYIWHTAYFLKRFTDNKSDSIKDFCKELQIKALSNPRNFDLLAVAARWAELELKEFYNNQK